MIVIDTCKDCRPPKRFSGCHDTCPEYNEAKEEALAKEKLKYKDRMVDGYVNGSIKRMKSRSTRGRGINHHAK